MSLMGPGHQGGRLFKEHRPPNGVKRSRIIQESKDRSIAFRFHSHHIIDHLSFHQWKWTEAPSIYETATMHQTHNQSKSSSHVLAELEVKK